jgi:hypothetical protein
MPLGGLENREGKRMNYVSRFAMIPRCVKPALTLFVADRARKSGSADFSGTFQEPVPSHNSNALARSSLSTNVTHNVVGDNGLRSRGPLPDR